MKALFLCLALLLLHPLAVVHGDTLKPVSATLPDRQAAPAPSAASGLQDGYVDTIRFWNGLKRQADTIEETLQRIAKSHPYDGTKGSTAFSAQLSKAYPGSALDDQGGTVPLSSTMSARFDKHLKVQQIEDVQYNIGKIYYLSQGKLTCSSRFNTATAAIDTANPTGSAFIAASLSDIKADAERIVPADFRTRTSVSAEVPLLNDAYQLLALTERERMDTFCAKVVSSKEARKKMLTIARKGYKERHPDQFSGSPAVPAKEQPAASLPVPVVDPGAVNKFPLTFFIILCTMGAVGVFLLLRLAFRRVTGYMDPFNNMKKIRESDKERRRHRAQHKKRDPDNRDTK